MKQLAGKCPQIFDCGLRTAVAFIRAVAKTDHPFGSMPQMISAFFFRFRRNSRQRLILRRHHGAPVRIGKRRVKELADDRLSKIAVRLLNQ